LTLSWADARGTVTEAVYEVSDHGEYGSVSETGRSTPVFSRTPSRRIGDPLVATIISRLSPKEKYLYNWGLPLTFSGWILAVPDGKLVCREPVSIYGPKAYNEVCLATATPEDILPLLQDAPDLLFPLAEH
jgi:hypothetical protein